MFQPCTHGACDQRRARTLQPSVSTQGHVQGPQTTLATCWPGSLIFQMRKQISKVERAKVDVGGQGQYLKMDHRPFGLSAVYLRRTSRSFSLSFSVSVTLYINYMSSPHGNGLVNLKNKCLNSLNQVGFLDSPFCSMPVFLSRRAVSLVRTVGMKYTGSRA